MAPTATELNANNIVLVTNPWEPVKDKDDNLKGTLTAYWLEDGEIVSVTVDKKEHRNICDLMPPDFQIFSELTYQF